MVQVKFLINFIASLWKEDLMQLLGKSSVHIKALMESKGPFLSKVLLLSRTISPLPNSPSFAILIIAALSFAILSLLYQASPSFVNLSLLCQPLPPLTTVSSFADLNHHCQPHSPLHSPIKLCSLKISLDKS